MYISVCVRVSLRMYNYVGWHLRVQSPDSDEMDPQTKGIAA